MIYGVNPEQQPSSVLRAKRPGQCQVEFTMAGDKNRARSCKPEDFITGSLSTCCADSISFLMFYWLRYNKIPAGGARPNFMAASESIPFNLFV